MVHRRRRLSCRAFVAAVAVTLGGCGGDATATGPHPALAATRIEVAGPAPGAIRVGPPRGAVLQDIDRDAGINVRLSDGSVMWLFGDTAIAEPDGHLRFFVIGTAAWAPADDPTVTRDYAGQDGRPVALAAPTAEFPACPSDAGVRGMWPASAIAYRVGSRDRIVVWLENVCLGDAAHGTGVGMAVAELWYDPSRPPDGRPVVARLLNQRLFPRRGFGLAATLGRHHDAFVYSCDAPAGGGGPNDYGPCLVGRVDLDRVSDPAAYRVWSTGGRWKSLLTRHSAPMRMPAGDPARRFPAGSVSVEWDATVGRYVMVYSPWPVRSTELEIRFAEQPEGPWTEPTSVPLAGCEDNAGGATYYCYAATAQPAFSEPGRLGVGYYDQLISDDPVRGSYLVTTVPIRYRKDRTT